MGSSCCTPTSASNAAVGASCCTEPCVSTAALGVSASSAASYSTAASASSAAVGACCSTDPCASTVIASTVTMGVSVSTVASASTTAQWYDIFINHRGADVKKSFPRSLYLRLPDKDLRAFLDQPEMQPGYNFLHQIEYAIETTSVHVAIISPNYAESPWCLDELVMMLQSNIPIIPVFYRVTPADIRWTKGKYAQDLKTLEEKISDKVTPRYDSNTPFKIGETHLLKLQTITVSSWRCAMGENRSSWNGRRGFQNLQDRCGAHFGDGGVARYGTHFYKDGVTRDLIAPLEELFGLFPAFLDVFEKFKASRSVSDLNTLWQTENQSQVPLQLAEFLEVLIVQSCLKLKSIHGSEHTGKLRPLNVGRCCELEELPSMETLTSLEEFYSDDCVKRKRIRGLELCAKLRVLNLASCSELEELQSMETLLYKEDF